MLESRKASCWSPGQWLCPLISRQALALGLLSQPSLCPSSTSRSLPSPLGFCCPQCLWLKRAAFLSGSAPKRVYCPTQCQGCGSIPISWGTVMLLEAFQWWSPAKPPAGAAWGAERVSSQRPLGLGDTQVNNRDDCNNVYRK